jgi:hypothetical protein
MPIVASDIKMYKSTNNLGGAITGNVVTSALLEDVFANITGDEATAGVTKYACLFVKNTHGTLTLTTVKEWILTNTPSADTDVKIGIAPEAKNTASEVIANENTAPTGVTFASHATEGAAITIPDLAPADYQAFWVELIVNAAAAATALDNFIIKVKGDSPA